MKKRHCSQKQIADGHSRKCLGVGINDVHTAIDCSKPYHIWHSMLTRCYGRNKKSSYDKCYVCDEWLTFSNFKQWFEDPKNGYQEGYHLDKDILVKGNLVYSPDNCVFVPSELNCMFIKRKGKRKELPIGVFKETHYPVFFAAFNKNGKLYRIGSFNNIEDASQAYKIAKEQYIKELAEKYFQEGKITKKVYDALMKYEVEITD